MAKARSEVVCDSSSIITLAEVCLLDVLSEMSRSGVKFYIPMGVKKEIVDTPISTKSFRFEAVRISNLIEKGVLTLIDKENVSAEAREIGGKIMAVANSVFSCEGRPIHLIDYGECDALGLALSIGCETILVDEKTTRLLIENPDALRQSLESRMGKRVDVSKAKLSELSSVLSGLSAIRSAEIVSVAFEGGLFRKVCCSANGKDVLFGALVAIKENGCSISEKEIEEYVSLLVPA